MGLRPTASCRGLGGRDAASTAAAAGSLSPRPLRSIGQPWAVGHLRRHGGPAASAPTDTNSVTSVLPFYVNITCVRLIAGCQRRFLPPPPTTPTTAASQKLKLVERNPQRAYHRLICLRTHGSPSFKLRSLILPPLSQAAGRRLSPLYAHMGVRSPHVWPQLAPR